MPTTVLRRRRAGLCPALFAGSLLLLGLLGILPPSTSAFLHNFSTLGLGIHNMTGLLTEKAKSHSPAAGTK